MRRAEGRLFDVTVETRHVEVGDRDGGGYRDPIRTCLVDGEDWPCPHAKAFDHEHGRLYEALKVAEERAELAGDDDIASDLRILRAKVGRHIQERWCGR